MNKARTNHSHTIIEQIIKGSNIKTLKSFSKALSIPHNTLMQITTMAVQLHGGYGYTREYDVERMMRDAKITEIYEGTSEVQKMVISANVIK